MRITSSSSLLFAIVVLASAVGDLDAQSSISVEDPRAEERGRARREAGETYAVGCPYTVIQIDVPAALTGTGFFERIQVMTPCGYDPQGPNVPLVFVWNGWGLSAGSFFNGMSDIPDEANLRGWLVCVVTGLDDQAFGAPKPQKNVEAALQYVVDNYKVDEDRIYGVGWSAGGGAMAAFTARNLDPARPMIAALATNAGNYDLNNSYAQENAAIQMIMQHPNVFAGPPVPPFLFNYLQSMTEYYVGTQLPPFVEPVSQARNLIHVPIYHVYSSDDPLTYLVGQNVKFRDYLVSKGANVTSTTFSGLPNPHDWTLLNAKTTLDFLQAHTALRDPADFEVNAFADKRYYWSQIFRRTTGGFGTLHAAVSTTANEIDLLDVTNVQAIVTTPPAAHFDSNAPFTLRLATADTGFTTVGFTGVTNPPTYVLAGTSLHKQWFHNANQMLLGIFDVPGATTTVLETRHDAYDAVLTGTKTVAPGGDVTYQMNGPTPNQSGFLLLGFDEGVLPLSTVDPNDDRNLLLGFTPVPVILPIVLNPVGQATLGFCLPNDPTLLGKTIRAQFVTYPGTVTFVDAISPRADTKIQIGG